MLNAYGMYTAVWKAAFYVCYFFKGRIHHFMLKLWVLVCLF